jgi:hypothetical protein
MTMTTDQRRALRHLGLGGAAALLAGGLALAAPAAAQDEPSGARDKTVTRVIVMSKAGEHPDGELRRFRILDANGGAPGCDKADVGDSAEKTKILVCGGDDQMSAADRAARLEKVLAGIQENDSMSAEHKAKVTAALREAIDRLNETR